jgi:hypothetical protein
MFLHYQEFCSPEEFFAGKIGILLLASLRMQGRKNLFQVDMKLLT